MFFNHPVKEKNANYRQTDIVFFFFRWYKKHTKIEQTERIAICCIISWICHIATQAGTIDSGHSAFFFFPSLRNPTSGFLSNEAGFLSIWGILVVTLPKANDDGA